ncbi:Integrase catalytic domain-containing protein [Durusdinium trenchii]|uniref:Integrase catalytic domain-containing protein n=1 Tax=Durusdinium trenchii TaxID=1381693 RepID=A0ABP0IGR7_9DINO
MNRVLFQLLDGRQLQVKALGGRLQCALDNAWQPAFLKMTFIEDGTVELPEIHQTVRLIDQEADRRRMELQELACFAGIAVKFQEVRSGAEIRVSIAAEGLQYTCNGKWRPQFKHLDFHADDVVVFPEIHHSAKLPETSAGDVRATLQALAAIAGYGADFPEARGKGCLRMTLAGLQRLQYTVDGQVRPPFSNMYFQEDFVHFPELGTTAKLPQKAFCARLAIQKLACMASLGLHFEEARGHGHICVTCADDRLLQYTVDGIPRPTFQQMVFLQDDMVDFPDIGTSIQLPHSCANELRAQLQDLACRVHLGVRFQTARGNRMIRFHLGHQNLQYTVDGLWRPTILQMTFHENGLLNIPELNKTVTMAGKEVEGLRILLQELAALAGLCVCFVEARCKDCIRISIAGDNLLQYTVNGSWRPCFTDLDIHEDGWVDFPDLGRKAQLPFDQVYTLRSQLRELQRRSREREEDTEASETSRPQPEANGGARWLVVDADSVQLTAEESDQFASAL